MRARGIAIRCAAVKVGFVVPAYQAAKSVGGVLRGLFEELRPGLDSPVVVVDDGSTDATSQAAREAGAEVIRHARNLGKGAALRTGFTALCAAGADAAVCVDADGQHPPAEAVRLARYVAPRDALVLGTRDLAAAGAPPKNIWSNNFSNRFLSFALGRTLLDTPVLWSADVATLALTVIAFILITLNAGMSRHFAYTSTVVGILSAVSLRIRYLYPLKERLIQVK